MRPRPATESCEGLQNIDVPILDDRRQLHVTELANVSVPAIRAPSPSEKNATGRLHETLPSDDPLAVGLMRTLTAEGSGTEAFASLA